MKHIIIEHSGSEFALGLAEQIAFLIDGYTDATSEVMVGEELRPKEGVTLYLQNDNDWENPLEKLVDLSTANVTDIKQIINWA